MIGLPSKYRLLQIAARVPRLGWVVPTRRVSREPVSRVFGWDRGLPIDRYYIQRFLGLHATDIGGDVLEVGSDRYIRRFGHDLGLVDVLHVSGGDTGVTIVGNLETGEGCPEQRYDCVVLTQVLQCILDIDAAIGHACTLLRPGGVLLATLPGIAATSRREAEPWDDLWRMTPPCARRLFERHLPANNIGVRAYGNALAACAHLQGHAFKELSAADLDFFDDDYPVIIGVRAVIPATVPGA